MADRYWRGGSGTWNTTSTTNWSATSGGASGASVPTAADNVIFDANSNTTGAFTVTVGAAVTCLNLTVSPVGSVLDGAMTLTGTSGITISGSLSVPSTNFSPTITGTLTFASTVTGRTISSGVSFVCPITFSGSGGSWTLQTALTTSILRTVTLTAGTLNLNSFTLTCGSFSSANTNTRQIQFGTGSITTTAASTPWNTSTVTGFSYTGTPNVNITNNSGTAATIQPGIMSEAQALNFNINAGTYTLTLFSGHTFRNLNFTGFAGTWSAGLSTYNIYGTLTMPATGGSFSATSTVNTFTFANTTGISGINTNGRTTAIPYNIVINCVGATTQLFSTVNSAGKIILTTGTLDLNSNALTITSFSSSNGNPRVIAFGNTGSGSITISSSTGWDTATITNFSYTGISNVRIATTTNPSISTGTGATEAQALNFNIVSGTHTFTLPAGSTVNNLNFTGFAGTWSNNTLTIYGSLIVSTGMTVNAGTGVVTFASTVAGNIITSNGKTLDFPIIFNGTGSWVLQGAMTMGSTRTCTLTQGNINLNSFTLTTGTFSSNNTNTREIRFGTGAITTTGSSGTVWNMSSITGFTYTGTSSVNISNSSIGAITITTGPATAAQALNFNVNTGGYTLTVSANSVFRDFKFTSFTGGTWTNNGLLTIYGSLTTVAPASMTITASASAVTFAATTTGNTITCAGNTLRFPIVFSGVGGAWTFQDRFISTDSLTLINGSINLNSLTTSTTGAITIQTGSFALSTGTLTGSSVTHNSGTLTITGAVSLGTAPTYTFNGGNISINDAGTLSVGKFSSNNSTARAIAFNTSGVLATIGSGLVWDTSTVTNFSYTGTPTVNISNNTATATTVTTGPMTAAQALNFNFTTGTYTLTLTTANVFNNLSFVGYTGLAALGFSAVTVYGNLSYGATGTSSANASGIITLAGTGIITTNANASIGHNLTIDTIGGTYTLQDVFNGATTATLTLTNGTLSLGTNIFRVGAFVSNNSNTRQIQFGTGAITTTGSGTPWNTGTVTGFSYTGTPTVNISNNTATAATVTTGPMSTAQALNFNITAGNYALSISSIFNNLSFAGFSGSVAGTTSLTVYGNLTYSGTATYSSGNGVVTLAGTGTQTITGNGANIGHNLTIDGIGGTFTLQNALTFNGAASTITLTNGTLSLGSFTLTTSKFVSSNSNIRSIVFGTGQINLYSNSTAVWDTSTSTNFSSSGTNRVNLTYTGSTGIRSVNNTYSPINVYVTAGTDIISINSGSSITDLNFTGFSGNWYSSTMSLFGNLTMVSAMTTSNLITPLTLTFAGTSGTGTITTHGKTLDFPMILDCAGRTYQFTNGFSQGSSRTFTMTNGTLDTNGQTVTLAPVTIQTGSVAITNTAVSGGAINCTSVTHTSGNLTVGGGTTAFGTITSTGTYTFTAGTITINNTATITATAFISSNTNTRSIAFGTGGAITTNGATTTSWDTTTITNFSYTGTSKINISNNSATNTSINTGTGATAAQALNFNFTTGTYSLTLPSNTIVNDLIFTGFSGTWNNTTLAIYGNLTLSNTMTVGAGVNTVTFANTSGTATINTNGRTIPFSMARNGVGGTTQLSSAVSSTNNFTLTNGTLDLNGKTHTVASFITATGTKSIAFNSGTIVCTGVTTTAFNNAVPTGFTTSAGTGVGTISMTGATAKTFVGGGSTFAAKLEQAGLGALTITGSNTFDSISNTVRPTSILFTAGTNTTVNGFTVNGTAGSLVTIGSSTAATHTLTDTSGSISVSYCTISNSIATGGATWNAYTTNSNINGGSNTGWIFTSPILFFEFFYT